MTGVPSLIVEGIDDIEIYINLTRRVPFDVEVYAVEHIEGYGQGCGEVIKAIAALENIPQTQYKLPSHILGVIDKDVRDYRGELPTSPAILVLKYYSIESHFISKAIIANTLRLCTKTSQDMITEELCDLIMSEIEVKLLDLYYHSLEALKNATQAGYAADFAYSFTPGRIKDVQAKALIEAKRSELDQFADSLNITRSIDSVKCIARGKWLIDVFSDELVYCIERLQNLCRAHTINSCLSCITNAYDKCLYRMKDGFNKNTIKSLAASHVAGVEFDYIVNRIFEFRPEKRA
ncbi:DUF4435 domain-containing protein [Pseudomonas chlororaphis]|uniref:DUF4435 domain-containing protein n=1 Tax=Pseudomonas chlororaphis TaxID=587753 RepID=UPI0013DE395F|nr:DUF4435 domain-containing protein [Pseudomonas chlororaphis]WDG94107.1 DUF4435 domain-containing protein [Pseudomonas chlororaphis]